MAKANGRPRGRPPHKNSKAAPSEPGDEQGAYTHAQLVRMDNRFRAPPAKPPAAGNRSVELASFRRWRRKLLLGGLRTLSCFAAGLAWFLPRSLDLPPPLLRLEVGLPPLVGLGTARIRRTRLHCKPSARRHAHRYRFRLRPFFGAALADVRHVAPTDPAPMI